MINRSVCCRGVVFVKVAKFIIEKWNEICFGHTGCVALRVALSSQLKFAGRQRVTRPM